MEWDGDRFYKLGKLLAISLIILILLLLKFNEIILSKYVKFDISFIWLFEKSIDS